MSMSAFASFIASCSKILVLVTSCRSSPSWFFMVGLHSSSISILIPKSPCSIAGVVNQSVSA
eukprot:13406653-Heterocapsa_arctica.AAC.1